MCRRTSKPSRIQPAHADLYVWVIRLRSLAQHFPCPTNHSCYRAFSGPKSGGEARTLHALPAGWDLIPCHRLSVSGLLHPLLFATQAKSPKDTGKPGTTTIGAAPRSRHPRLPQLTTHHCIFHGRSLMWHAFLVNLIELVPTRCAAHATGAFNHAGR